jgi:bifunctional DNA-binding transcriptional regulator/antitoxin component of YhaV-PrlF toxin-antitoxin module
MNPGRGQGPSGMTTFRAPLSLDGRTATGIAVPPEVVEALDGGKQPLVVVRLGDYEYRSKVGVRKGQAMVPVSAEHRKAAGVAAGDQVEVTLTLDTAPRVVEVPEDLAAALDAEPGARAAFDALSASGKKAITANVEGAKTPETRARRVAKAVAGLVA